MNYPIWELSKVGGGSLIALISILHVYISHLAVGGGAFIWLTDLKGCSQKNPLWQSFVHKHSWFFLLLTMVFGGVTGVGIWFIISLVAPAATSKLIHTFVFGWAIEWVFFVGEITALLIYYYYFEKLSQKNRLIVAFLYFLFAWLSLFVINGILSFMLTPGKWLETQNFWHGFFNPTFFSSLIFRTFIAAIIAGLFGLATSVFYKPGDFKNRLIKYCTAWLLYPLPGLVLAGIWFYFTIPADIRRVAFFQNPQTTLFMTLLIFSSLIIFVIGIYLHLKVKAVAQKLLTLILLLTGLAWMGGFEYCREIARKPFVINKYLYSSSIQMDQISRLKNDGVLQNAKWVANVSVAKEDMAAGKELFKLECSSCHTINGFRNDIVDKIENKTFMGIKAQLYGQGKVQKYMPPFVGTEEEMGALATYLIREINKESITQSELNSVNEDWSFDIPEFQNSKNDYVLFVWNDLGMHCISDCFKWFTILPPANTLEAQIIKRGETPEIVTDGVEIEYRVENGFEQPSDYVDFWTFAQLTFGVNLDMDIGLSGKGMNGLFDLNENGISFIAEKIPVVPYSSANFYNPYPFFEIIAKNKQTEEILIKTKVVAPNSTEMGCRNCHGGEWRWNNRAGIGDDTAINILKSHDRLSGTKLYKNALKGQPKLCQSCHADPALGTEGRQALLNFSSSIHGWHANYMPVEGAQACILCHPAQSKESTRCFRGLHNTVGLTCIDCHGTLDEHALSLLRGQEQKTGAARLMKNLVSLRLESVENVNARIPWQNEPDCLTCHADFQKPGENPSAYNVWTAGSDELYKNRTSDEGSLRCPACHNSTHSLYPAINSYGKNRDNIQPLQYSGKTYPIGSNGSCVVCHKEKMQDSIHHKNMERAVRNPKI